MKKLHPRSIFANEVCQLILIKHNCSLNSALEDLKSMREYFKQHVPNTYELDIKGMRKYFEINARKVYELDREIPLFDYLQHINCTFVDLGYKSQEEYEEKMYDIFDSMCKRFGDKMLLANLDIPLCKKMCYCGYNNNQIEKLFNKDDNK